MRLSMKLFVASAAMLASTLFSGAPAAHAAAVNYVIAFTGQATITSGDTCGSAVCYTGGNGSFSFGGSTRCAVVFPSPTDTCSVTLTTGTFANTDCGTGTADGTASSAQVTVNGVTHTVVNYHINFRAGNGTLNGTLDDGSSITGAVNISPSDSNGHGVETPAPGSPGDGACTNGFKVAVVGEN